MSGDWYQSKVDFKKKLPKKTTEMDYSLWFLKRNLFYKLTSTIWLNQLMKLSTTVSKN